MLTLHNLESVNKNNTVLFFRGQIGKNIKVKFEKYQVLARVWEIRI